MTKPSEFNCRTTDKSVFSFILSALSASYKFIYPNYYIDFLSNLFISIFFFGYGDGDLEDEE